MPRKRNDVWYARVQIKGKRTEVSLGKGASKQDALQLEARYRRDAVAGKLGVAPKRTIDEALVKWLEGEASLLKSYRNVLGKVKMIEPYCSGVPLTDIAKVALKVKEDFIKEGLKPATINRRLAILRRVANLAYSEWDWLDQDLGKRIKEIPGESGRTTYLTIQQARLLAEKCEHPRVKDAILLACMSGLREGELLRLTADSVRDGCIMLPSNTKANRPRVIPLPAEALAIPLPLDIGYSTLRTYYEKARDAVGLSHVRFHDLRHTYASWFLQSGGNLVALRDLLGHSTIAVTADMYSHLETKHLRAGVTALETMMSENKVGQ
jgi:integrase